MESGADEQGRREIPSRVQSGLDVLVEAAQYARLTSSDRWDFAVEIRQLRALGLSPNDLRLLVRMQLVEHASEVTVPGQNGRQFQPTGNLTFTKRSCFVLASRCDAAGPLCDRRSEPAAPRPAATRTALAKSSDPGQVPTWDAERRVLRFDGQIVKQFKWHAINQETILAAFEEEGWPAKIDDPLPPQPEQDSKRRLIDTIKCLNRKQKTPLLRFCGDGTGEGVIWEIVEPTALRDRS